MQILNIAQGVAVATPGVFLRRLRRGLGLPQRADAAAAAVEESFCPPPPTKMVHSMLQWLTLNSKRGIKRFEEVN